MSNHRADDRPITLAVVNDYEIVVRGVAAMLTPYAHRLVLVELDVRRSPSGPVDIALFDTFGGRRHTLERAHEMVTAGTCKHVVLYTWDANIDVLRAADKLGVSAVLFKSMAAEELVDALESMARGERIGLGPRRRRREPRHETRLSSREREILALLARGHSNREIGDELFLAEETIKTYVRRLYRKLGVRNRVQASARAADFDVAPPLRARPPLHDE